MKNHTIDLGENKIELYSSLIGKEIVKVNDNIVSNKYAFFGAEHFFTIVENGKEMKCKIDMGGFSDFKFHKDDKPVIISQKNHFLNFLIFIIVFTLLKISF